MTNNVECVRESGALSIARRLAYATYPRKRSVESTSDCGAASILFLEHRNIAPVTNGSFFAGVIVRAQRDGHITPFNLFFLHTAVVVSISTSVSTTSRPPTSDNSFSRTKTLLIVPRVPTPLRIAEKRAYIVVLSIMAISLTEKASR